MIYGRKFIYSLAISNKICRNKIYQAKEIRQFGKILPTFLVDSVLKCLFIGLMKTLDRDEMRFHLNQEVVEKKMKNNKWGDYTWLFCFYYHCNQYSLSILAWCEITLRSGFTVSTALGTVKMLDYLTKKKVLPSIPSEYTQYPLKYKKYNEVVWTFDEDAME